MTDAIDPIKQDPIKLSSDDYQLAAGNGGDGRKLGHKCCGGCCDVRRAVIIVNIINAVLLTLSLSSAVLMHKASGQMNVEGMDDDSFLAALEEFNNFPIGGFLAIQTVKILLSVAGILGAVQFNQVGVGLAMFGYLFDAAMALVGFNLLGLLFPLMFAYPHGFLIKEIRAGIMTKRNYASEEYSCCCV